MMLNKYEQLDFKPIVLWRDNGVLHDIAIDHEARDAGRDDYIIVRDGEYGHPRMYRRYRDHDAKTGDVDWDRPINGGRLGERTEVTWAVECDSQIAKTIQMIDQKHGEAEQLVGALLDYWYGDCKGNRWGFYDQDSLEETLEEFNVLIPNLLVVSSLEKRFRQSIGIQENGQSRWMFTYPRNNKVFHLIQWGLTGNLYRDLTLWLEENLPLAEFDKKLPVFEPNNFKPGFDAYQQWNSPEEAWNYCKGIDDRSYVAAIVAANILQEESHFAGELLNIYNENK